MTKKILFLGVCVAVLVGSLVGMGAPQGGAVAIDSNDIGGVVTSDKGPEAGVWVIAETTDLPTRFIRTVVTDDQGRYVVPDLPAAKYQVFVRGYGLVDSPKVAGEPGTALNLKAVVAPNERAAAEYYPARYLVLDARHPREERVPDDGEALPGHAGGVHSCVEHRHVHLLPSDWNESHARAEPEAGHVSQLG